MGGKLEFQDIIENTTYKIESDEATGLREKIIIESKDKTKIPTVHGVPYAIYLKIIIV